MKVEKIDHIHIAVKDLERATNFFSQVLGSKFSDTIVVPQEHLISRVDNLGIEIVESTSSQGSIARFIERRGEGLHAISVKVPDIMEAIAELKSRGIRQVGWVEVGKVREAQFHPKDSFGVMLELCEYQAVNPGAMAALGRV